MAASHNIIRSECPFLFRFSPIMIEIFFFGRLSPSVRLPVMLGNEKVLMLYVGILHGVVMD